MPVRTKKSRGRTPRKSVGRGRPATGRKTVSANKESVDKEHKAIAPGKRGRKPLAGRKPGAGRKRIHLNKKDLKRLKKSTKKLEKVSEKSILAKDKVSQLNRHASKLRLRIKDGKQTGATRIKLRHLREKLKSSRMELKQAKTDLNAIREKIRKRKNKIKMLKSGK